jgi:hypothetical protein
MRRILTFIFSIFVTVFITPFAIISVLIEHLRGEEQ